MKRKNMTERRKMITDILRRDGKLRVADLAEKYNVSSVTIRRDLDYLEEVGVGKRSFGYIHSISDQKAFGNQASSSIDNLKYKSAIGQYAASLIQSNDSIFFYAGSTVQQIIKYINPDIEFFALTNSVYIAQELLSLPKAHTVLVGGLLSNNGGLTYGEEAIRQLKAYNIHRLFLSVDGISAESGITNASPFEKDINREVISHAQSVIVVADHTKVGHASFIRMADISDIDILITDSTAQANHVQDLIDAGVSVYTVSID